MEHAVLAAVREILAGPSSGTSDVALDELTGVYSAEFGVRRLQEEAERALRYRHALTCFILDVDHLSAVNEQHGPARADRVLQDVGAILRHAARSTDVVARLAGDQFLLITPRLDAPAARAQAERFCQRLARHRFPVPGGAALTLTASCGVAAVSEAVADAQALIEHALRALAAAKAAGGDQIALG
jgi:diguanylate cyclase (GGDEF)-like protein